MRLEKFQPEDWFLDDPIEIIEAPYDRIMDLANRSVAFSAFEGYELIACGGLAFWNDDEAEAWIRISKKGFRCRKAGIRCIKELWKILLDTSPPDMNIFCWVDAEWLEAQRLVGWLGFTPTHESRKLNDNRLYFVWELANGNDNDDSRDSGICYGTDATSLDDETAGRSPSTNIGIQCSTERN